MWGEEEKRFKEREEEAIKEGKEGEEFKKKEQKRENETKEEGEGRNCCLVPDS